MYVCPGHSQLVPRSVDQWLFLKLFSETIQVRFGSSLRCLDRVGCELAGGEVGRARLSGLKTLV